MKLSVVIICWNDLKDIGPCLESVFAETSLIDYEVIVTDNGSTDGSVEYIRTNFPKVKLVENKKNLGFGGANNQGFRVAQGDYVLILNPDTIIRDRAIEKLVAYADQHPDVGALGCRMLNKDGSYQRSAHPTPTVRTYFVAALYLRFLGRFSDAFLADTYVGWNGATQREIGFQAACCLLIQGPLLKQLNGFDERLFFQMEDVDLCLRVRKTGKSVQFYPGAQVTHIGGANRGRYPLPVVLETQRSFYRFFYKHYGVKGLKRLRYVLLTRNAIRLSGYSLISLIKRGQTIETRVKMHRLLLKWHWNINPVRFIETGDEPASDCKPLAPAPKM
jgi:GT2 family glycosyltransferase